ncbi:hypothetical protein [Liberiplasma polymorphum]|uniref:hypothetical protein n=1 Tax=Liberiplasma polymorphum TaxID=3374570 RepID=UPI003774A9D6
MFEDFVNRYKVILDIKKAHPLKMRFSYVKNQLIILVCSFLFIGIGIGYFTNLLESFNYVFLLVNSLFGLMYILYSVSTHKHYQYHTKRNYDIKDVLIVEGSRFFSYFLLYNVFIYSVFLSFVGSIIIFILLIILSITANIIYFLVSIYVSPKMMRETIYYSLILFIGHMAIIYLLPIKGIALNYTISYGIVIIFYLYKNFTNSALTIKPFEYSKLAIITIIIAGGYIVAVMSDNEFDLFSYDFQFNEPIVLAYDYHFNQGITYFNPWNLTVEEDKIYLVEREISNGMVLEEFLNIYDINGNLLSKLEVPEAGGYRLESTRGFYYQILRYPSCPVTFECTPLDGELPNNYVYRLNENLEFEMILELTGNYVSHHSYFIENDDVSYLLVENEIGFFDETTKTIEWYLTNELDDFSFYSTNKFIFIEENIVYNNISHLLTSNVHFFGVPFWPNNIYAYNEGYAISYQEELASGNYVLLHLDTEEIYRLPNVKHLPYQFVVIDDYLIYYTNLSHISVYNLTTHSIKNVRFDGMFSWITTSSAVTINQDRINNEITINMIDFDAGIKKIINPIEWPVLLGIPTALVIFSTIKLHTKKFASPTKHDRKELSR